MDDQLLTVKKVMKTHKGIGQKYQQSLSADPITPKRLILNVEERTYSQVLQTHRTDDEVSSCTDKLGKDNSRMESEVTDLTGKKGTDLGVGNMTDSTVLPLLQFSSLERSNSPTRRLPSEDSPEVWDVDSSLHGREQQFGWDGKAS